MSVGNFDVTSLAMAFDYVRLGIAHAAQVANERVQKLLWQHFTGLPTGLARERGAHRRAATARALVRRARLGGALPRQPGVARLPRAACRGRRGPRLDGAAGRQHDLEPGQPGPPAGRARADHRRPGRRPARRTGAARARHRPRVLAGPRVRGDADRRDRVERRRRGAGAGSSATAGWRAASPAWRARARRCPSTSRRGSSCADVAVPAGRSSAPSSCSHVSASSPPSSTVAELATDAGMPTSTAYRLLAELEQHGLVQRGPDSTVALGTRIVALGRTAEAGLRERLVVPATPVMAELSARGRGDGDPDRAVRTGGDRAPRRGGRAPLGAGSPTPDSGARRCTGARRARSWPRTSRRASGRGCSGGRRARPRGRARSDPPRRDRRHARRARRWRQRSGSTDPRPARAHSSPACRSPGPTERIAPQLETATAAVRVAADTIERAYQRQPGRLTGP